MRTAAILPVKSFGTAKQRLGELIEQDARSALMRAMLADVLDALAGVPELDQVLVVTANPLAAELAHDARVHVLHDHREDGPVGSGADRHRARARGRLRPCAAGAR